MENFVRVYTDELEELTFAAESLYRKPAKSALDCAAYNVVIDALRYIKGQRIANPSMYASKFFTLEPEVLRYETAKWHQGANKVDFPTGWETAVERETR